METLIHTADGREIIGQFELYNLELNKTELALPDDSIVDQFRRLWGRQNPRFVFHKGEIVHRMENTAVIGIYFER